MPKDEIYFFHQTPPELCKELVKQIGLKEDDIIFEPFAGEGAFVKAFPNEANVIITEIEDGKDYKSVNLEERHIDWVITNPPFRLERTEGRRTNAFYELCEYFAGKTRKGFAFLGNDYCLATFTPKRIKYLQEEKGVYISKIIVCNVKKWRGRYFFVIFRNKCNVDDPVTPHYKFFDYIEGSF